MFSGYQTGSAFVQKAENHLGTAALAWFPQGLRELISDWRSGWIGFRKAFWRVRTDLLYLTEPLILMVGAGRFERPTPCAQGRCATRLRYAPTPSILHRFPLPRAPDKT